ncbi:MAG: hypothetical protein ACRDMV_25255 [Streptosporangiales bacterium]
MPDRIAAWLAGAEARADHGHSSPHDASVTVAALRAVLEVHRPTRIYEDCGHEHTDEDVAEGRAEEIDDVGVVCEDGYQYTICVECCSDGGRQTEECAVDHTPCDDCWPCPTRAAIARHLPREDQYA